MGSPPARYTAQLVVMVEPEIAARVRAWAVHGRVSNAAALREIFEAGLEVLDCEDGPWETRFGRLPRRLYVAALATANAMANRALARKRGELGEDAA